MLFTHTYTVTYSEYIYFVNAHILSVIHYSSHIKQSKVTGGVIMIIYHDFFIKVFMHITVTWLKYRCVYIYIFL